jgi:hypothetical protein
VLGSGPIHFHIVKKGETLSKLSHEFFKERTYGPNGSLAKLLSLNPQIKNPHMIKPGDKIFISMSEKEKVAPAREFASKNEAIPIGSSDSFIFAPFWGVNSIKASDRVTGAKASVASDTNFGLMASYGIDWEEDFKTYLSLRLNRIHFEKPIDSSIKINDRDLFLSTIEIGAYNQLSRRLGIGLMAGYGNELFLRSEATNVLAVDKVSIPSVGGSVQLKLKESQNHQLSLGLTYKTKLPAKTDQYRVQLGHELGVGLELAKVTGDSRTFKTDVNFNYRNQDTSITRQTEFGIVVGVHFFFSGEGR